MKLDGWIATAVEPWSQPLTLTLSHDTRCSSGEPISAQIDRIDVAILGAS
jgi:hypothetical protein